MSTYHIDNLERRAYIANDRATLSLIALAEDAAGLALEEARERRAEILAASRGVTDLRSENATLQARIRLLEHKLQQANRLAYAVDFVLRPFRQKAAPKWAAYLRNELEHLQKTL